MMKYDWAGRLGPDQVANLQALVDVTEPAVLAAVDRWLAALERESVQHLPGEVYGLGGAMATVDRGTTRQLSIALRSGGEDAFDSIQSAADDLYDIVRDVLHDVVRDGDDALIRWVELPYE